MNILFISNFYPPEYIGGYEIGARYVQLELEEQGHKVTVVTSKYSKKLSNEDRNIYRTLNYSFKQNKLVSVIFAVLNLVEVRKKYSIVRPDVVVYWGLLYTSFSLLFGFPDRRVRKICYVSDESYVHCDFACRLLLRLQVLTAGTILSMKCLDAFRSIHFVSTSNFIRDTLTASLVLPVNSKVIHWGTPRPQCENSFFEGEIRIMFGGRLAPDKGQLIALQAIRVLLDKQCLQHKIRVRILSEIDDSTYCKQVNDVISALAVDIKVDIGSVPLNEVDTELSNCDLFVLPSVWNEPFSTLLVQALCRGCVAVVTQTGGSPEALSDLPGHFLSEPRASALAETLLVALSTSDFSNDGKRIRSDAATSKYSMSKMVEQLLVCSRKSMQLVTLDS